MIRFGCRRKAYILPLVLVLCYFITLSRWKHPQGLRAITHPKSIDDMWIDEYEEQLTSDAQPTYGCISTSAHPIEELVQEAESLLNHTLEKQSNSLEEAVREYRRRYQISPPPNFDLWYQFAEERESKYIDEYDSIYEYLLPFWALKPSTIRARAREAIGYEENMLMGVILRHGKVANIIGGTSWEQESTRGMIQSFVKFLPNMDLAFNTQDEPRIIVPFSRLSRMVDVAKGYEIPAAFANKLHKNSFSPPSVDVDNDGQIATTTTTKFNKFAHQAVWSHAILSCHPNSPAAKFFDDEVHDDTASYKMGDIGFIHNVTAFSDICSSPSLSQIFGFFDRPNAFNVVLDLFPIFSQSKVSSFQDILYPSPWYWSNKVPYEQKYDVPWDRKENALYWRGTTTGGFSRNGGWRRQHRQHFVRKMASSKNVSVMVKSTEGNFTCWQIKTANAIDYADIFDVKFVAVGQCDPDDCDDQQNAFNIVAPEDQRKAWNFKHLLDLDGNAFSGRFYALLQSSSLVYKMAIFREWHNEWLKPWAHYIPLSLKGGDWLEAVRYFSKEKDSDLLAERIASQSQEWAKTVLRKEDMEVWMFRLLLEYGRLIDDNREKIGFSLAY